MYIEERKLKKIKNIYTTANLDDIYILTNENQQIMLAINTNDDKSRICFMTPKFISCKILIHSKN
jgi:hypothetical protein